jgi:hypothetical protein
MEVGLCDSSVNSPVFADNTLYLAQLLSKTALLGDLVPPARTEDV